MESSCPKNSVTSLSILGKKPRHESLGIAFKCDTGKLWPVKVKFPSTDHVHHILKQARTLKQFSTHSSVFIAPNRTKNEREGRRGVVAAHRKKIHDEPEKHHYIIKMESSYQVIADRISFCAMCDSSFLVFFIDFWVTWG